MSSTKRTEFDKWVILLDPGYAAALEAAFDKEEAREKDFPDQKAAAEHNEDNLVTATKSQAQAVQAASAVYDSPYGKIHYYKKDESDFKTFREHYDRTMYVWQTLVKGYTDMIQTEKTLPDEDTIRGQINQASRTVDRDVDTAKNAEVGLKNAAGFLELTWNEFNAAKGDIDIVVREVRISVAAGRANDLQEEAEKVQEVLDIVTKTIKGASEAAHNPVGAAAEAAEAIKAADDLLDDDSLLNQARTLREKVLHASSKLADDKAMNAVDRLQKAYKVYSAHREDIEEARKNAEDQSGKAERTFDTDPGKHFKFAEIDLLLYKAGAVQTWVGDFEKTSDLVPQDVKDAWLTAHPQHEENKKTTDRYVALIYNHRKDSAGFKKAADATVDTWKRIRKDAHAALLHN